MMVYEDMVNKMIDDSIKMLDAAEVKNDRKQLGTTQSVCQKCKKVIPAEILSIDGQVFLNKKCKEHGSSIVRHVWNDEKFYKVMRDIPSIHKPTRSNKSIITITNRCNMNCPICFAKAGELNHDEFDIDRLNELEGFEYVYITGGEPTVRSDLFTMLLRLRSMGKKAILFSNGIKISDIEYAKKLKGNVELVILQFDSPIESDNIFIRGMKTNDIKIKAILNMKRLGIPIYVNSVAVNGRNMEHLKDYFRFLSGNGIKIIGFNPVWEIGRFQKGHFMPTDEIMKRIQEATGIEREDFMDSTIFLHNLQNLRNIYRKDPVRNFSKCVCFALFINRKGRLYRLRDMINIENINRELLYAVKHKTRVRFFLMALIPEITKGFIFKKGFRQLAFIFVKNIIKELRNIPNMNKFRINPFTALAINTFPTPENIDFELVRTCNLMSVSCIDYKARPGCLSRFDLNE